MSAFARRMWRAVLTDQSLLSEDEVVEALPARESAAVAWLNEHVVPFGKIDGEKVYRWGDVVEALCHAAPQAPDTARWLSTEEAASRLGIARCTLDAIVARAPPDLAGAPVLAGAGVRRRRWRWNADTLGTWFAAFTEWERTRTAKPARSARRTPPQTRDDRPVDWSAAGTPATRSAK